MQKERVLKCWLPETKPPSCISLQPLASLARTSLVLRWEGSQEIQPMIVSRESFPIFSGWTDQCPRPDLPLEEQRELFIWELFFPERFWYLLQQEFFPARIFISPDSDWRVPRTCTSMVDRIPSGKGKVFGSNFGLNLGKKGIWTSLQYSKSQALGQITCCWMSCGGCPCVVLAHGNCKVLQFSRTLSLLN